MARPEKIAEVDAISQRIKAAQSMVLADYSGLSVAQMTVFRQTCRSQAVDCRVVKNRLARIAADKTGMADMVDRLKGPTAIIFGMESQVAPAKIVVDFAKENEAMKIKGGFVGDEYLDETKVVALSAVPSKDELIAKMMGSINSPVQGLVMVTNGVIAGLARAIDAVAKQKAEAA